MSIPHRRPVFNGLPPAPIRRIMRTEAFQPSKHHQVLHSKRVWDVKGLIDGKLHIYRPVSGSLRFKAVDPAKALGIIKPA